MSDDALAGPVGIQRRRAALLAGILAAHAALIAVVAIGHSAADRSAAVGSRLITFDVAVPKAVAEAERVQPVVPVKQRVSDPSLVRPSPISPTVALASDSAALGDGGCDLTETLQAALRSDPLARAAVASLPAGTRTVANAVMLWDGHAWIAGGGAQAQGSLGIIRRVAGAVVTSASQECRDQPQAGPRLIVMPGSPDVTLALGSGRWRWGDLAPTAEAPERIAAVMASFSPGAFNFQVPIDVASNGTMGSYLNISFIKNHVLQGDQR